MEAIYGTAVYRACVMVIRGINVTYSLYVAKVIAVYKALSSVHTGDYSNSATSLWWPFANHKLGD